MSEMEKDRPTDLDLIEGIKSGDTEKFEELFKRYQFLALKVTRSYVVIDYDVDDLLQEARILFFQGIHEYKSERGMSFGNFYKLKLNHFFYNLIRRQNAAKRQGAKYCDSLDEVQENSSDEDYRYSPQKEVTPEDIVLVQEDMSNYYTLRDSVRRMQEKSS